MSALKPAKRLFFKTLVVGLIKLPICPLIIHVVFWRVLPWIFAPTARSGCDFWILISHTATETQRKERGTEGKERG